MLIIILVSMLMVTMMMTIRRLTINKVAIAGSPDPPLPTTHHCEPTFLTYWLPHIVNCNSAMCYKQTAERKSKLCRHYWLLHRATTHSAWENDETICCKQTAARTSATRYCMYRGDLLRSVPFRTVWHQKMCFWFLKAGAKSSKLWLVYVKTITKNMPCHLPGFFVQK